MIVLELCVVVIAPILIFVIVAQRIPQTEENNAKIHRRARYRGKFAEE